MKTASTPLRRSARLVIIAPIVALLYGPTQGMAAVFLGSDLESFTVLGASTVTNVSPSAIGGNVGVWSSGGANAITGFNSSPGVAVSDPQVTGGLVHAGTAAAQSAQGQLTTARSNLGSLGVGTLLGADLAGLTIMPGVYTVPAGTTNLSGLLILDGGGNANAAWVFQMPSTLITSPNSGVSVINTGSGAGLYWNVGSSATIDLNTTFFGNIFADASITMNTSATDSCGRAAASTGAVTLDQNTLSGSCLGILAGSNGLSGGLDLTDAGVQFLPYAPVSAVPIPGAILLFGSALAGLFAFRKRLSLAA